MLVSKYRGLERVGSWVPGGSVGRDQLAMAAKVRRHWFNPCRLGSRDRLGANFSLLLYTDLIKKRKPSRYFTDEGELIRKYISYESQSLKLSTVASIMGKKYLLCQGQSLSRLVLNYMQLPN